MSRLALATAVLLLATAPLGAQPGAGAAASYHPGVDVVDYEFSLDLPDIGSGLEGRAVISLRRVAPTDTLRLDLVALRVDSVLVNGRPVAFARDSSRLRVPLPAAGDSLAVTVRYGGSPRDGLIVTLDPQGRWLGFGDNWPNRARHWLPTVDHPSDKATVTWIVRAPADRRVVANGVLAEETPITGGSARYAGSGYTLGAARTLTRWRMARPIPSYLMVIAAAPLAYYDLGATACGAGGSTTCVRQMVYAAPELRDFLPGPFARAGAIVEFIAGKVGPFPYERLAHLQSSTRFGGMENATAIFYSDKAFRQRTLGTGLVAHETAHQWFGDAVTEREWGHLWLSEGFASYFEQLWVAHSLGETAFRDGMRELRDEIAASKVTPLRPVIDTAQRDLMALLNTNSYQKGAWVLHMLRHQVGDSAFFTGVRSYYAKYRDATATTDDLRREMEGAAGEPLGWFFDQWLRRPGMAEVAVKWKHDARGRRTTIEVVQSARYAPYRFPLTVAVVVADGSEQRVTVEVPMLRKARIVLPVELDGPPRRLVFDPDVALLATFAP
ncbi:MAG TPA: M1 family metallopeptidase [Gemmatimonadaceae bacterium]|nr:M1 family metallopeptidase [Gemmatimonadaceae bacterium]